MRNIKLPSKTLFPVGSVILTLVVVGAFSLRNADVRQWLGQTKIILILVSALGVFIVIGLTDTARKIRTQSEKALRESENRYHAPQ